MTVTVKSLRFYLLRDISLFVMYYMYRHVRAIPTYSVYTILNTVSMFG